MATRTLVVLPLLLVSSRNPCPAFAESHNVPPVSAAARQVLVARGDHGLFVPSVGQWGEGEAIYRLRAGSLDVAFDCSGMRYYPVSTGDASPLLPLVESGDRIPTKAGAGIRDGASDALWVTFPGSQMACPQGLDPSGASFNFYFEDGHRGSHIQVPGFSALVYQDLYEGIDLYLRSTADSVLKYEFHVAPGADLSALRVAYRGAKTMCLDAGGNLLIETAHGTLVDSAPTIWQDTDAGRVYLRGGFGLIGGSTYRFGLAESPDPRWPMVIDPEVQWMTYLGGTSADVAGSVAAGLDGSVYVTGSTSSSDFDGAMNEPYGTSDAFVARYSSTGELIWTTYVGGSGDDFGADLCVKGSGEVVMVGDTRSSDFSGAQNGYGGEGDAFVASMDHNGLLQSMRFLGGQRTDVAFGIAEGADGAVFVSGRSSSADLPSAVNSLSGFNEPDAFLIKVAPDSTVEWSRYVGGSLSDHGYDVAAQPGGVAVICGYTHSSDIADANNLPRGQTDGFVAAVDSAGALQWLNYLGGTADDYVRGVATDSAGYVFVTGYSDSTDWPDSINPNHGGFNPFDAFLIRADPIGAVEWMRYLGGTGGDFGTGVTIDLNDQVLITGYTGSIDFDGRVNDPIGQSDGFVTKLQESGNVQWTVYLGGSKTDEGSHVAVDAFGNAYVVGDTVSDDFVGGNNSHHGDWDAFLVRIRNAYGPRLFADGTCPLGGPVVVSWQGTDPLARVAIIFSRNQGDYLIPFGYPCQGVMLGLGGQQIQVVYDGRSDALGTGRKNSTAGSGACGGYLQLLDIARCEPSNVVRID